MWLFIYLIKQKKRKLNKNDQEKSCFLMQFYYILLISILWRHFIFSFNFMIKLNRFFTFYHWNSALKSPKLNKFFMIFILFFYLELFAVEPADDLDLRLAIESPCLITRPWRHISNFNIDLIPQKKTTRPVPSDQKTNKFNVKWQRILSLNIVKQFCFSIY